MNITNLILNSIKNNYSLCFIKIGDGEIYCLNGCYGQHNCDGDFYTYTKQQKLIESIKYLTDNCENLYVGKWHTDMYDIQKSLQTKNINYADYHSLILDDNDILNNNQEKINIYREIKNSNRKKLIICNPLLAKSKLLLNIDEMVNIPFNNWFENYDEIKNQVISKLGNVENPIILMCGGIASKILASDLFRKYPNSTILDVGSAIDFICTKKNSRGWKHSYNDLVNYLKEIIPENWEHDSYNYIYNESKNRLGIHLH